MKILIFGSGMYVTGKRFSPTGTVLSSVLQASKSIDIHKIVIISYSQESKARTLDSAKYTNDLLGTDLSVEFEWLSDKPNSWLQEFIERNNFDVCINSLPDNLHFDFVKLTLVNEIPTLVVKPLTPTYTEGKQLFEIAQGTNTYCAVEFHKRWDESNLYLKKTIEDGRLGEILYFSIDYSQQIQIPTEQFAKWSENTNIFQYLGVHYVDLIFFLTGARPKSLSVYGTKKKLVSLGIQTWDSVHVSSIWGDANSDKNDFYAHFNLNWIDPNQTTAMSDQKVLMVGSDGRVELDQKNRGVYEVTKENGAKSINPYFATWLPDSDRLEVLNGYGYRSIFTFIQDVSKIMVGAASPESLYKVRPGIESSLVSTKFLDVVNEKLKLECNERIDL